MKVLLASTRLFGHLNPLLHIGRRLAKQGHEIVMTTGTAYSDKVTAAGFPFHPLLGKADFDGGNLNAAFPERAALEAGLPQLRFDIERIFVDTIPDQFATLEQVLLSFPADLIIADFLFNGTLPFLLGATAQHRPRIASVGMTPLPWPRNDGAPYGPGLPLAETAEELATYRGIAESVREHISLPAARYFNEAMARYHAVPVEDWFATMISSPDLYLQNAVPGFEYPRQKPPANLRFVGNLYSTSTAPVDREIRRKLEEAKEHGRRIVYVTQGTLTTADSLGMILGPTLKAFADDENILMVLTTGGAGTEALGTVPANAIVTGFMPLDHILPYADVVVTNGGYGTVTEAIATGVPIVAAGLTEDKAEVTARVEWAGVGINLHTETPDPEAIRNAVHRVTTEAEFSRKAKELAAEYARYREEGELEKAVAEVLRKAEVVAAV